jgi:hypothetical protein
MLCASKVVYAILALGFSVFYAWKAVDIFVDTEHPFIKQKMTMGSWRFHQRWVNFMGSAVGWSAGYYYIFVKLPQSGFAFKIEDTILILITLLGIFGFLPNALSKVSLEGVRTYQLLPRLRCQSPRGRTRLACSLQKLLFGGA